MSNEIIPTNETLEILYRRASLRNFSEEPVPDEVLSQILEAGVCSATGGNLQPYSVIVIRNKKTMQTLADWCSQGFIKDAPVNLLFCLDWHRTAKWCEMECAPYTANQSFRHFWIAFQDTIIAAQNIATAADSLGLGSVYIGTIIEFIPECRELFKLPDAVVPVVLLSLGYPKTVPKKARKLGQEIVVHQESYQPVVHDVLAGAILEKYGNRKAEITENDPRIDRIYKVCLEVGGEDFARKCTDTIKEQGYISKSQHYFGLHYLANVMPAGNHNFVEQMEKAGFNWFKSPVMPVKT